MAYLKDFFNKISNNNRIFTAEDIGEMSGSEFSQNKNAINYQMESLGICSFLYTIRRNKS